MEAPSNSGSLLVSCENKLEATMLELAETRKGLERAREAAMQSWLDSKPLIDELEKQQEEIVESKARVSVATAAISTLELQLVTTNASTKSTQEDTIRAQVQTEEIRKDLEEIQGYMSQLEAETKKERLARDKLKQDLRIMKQSLRALLMMNRAVRMETEAVGASAGSILDGIKHSEEENPAIALTNEEYFELTRKAKEETSLADWRVSASLEQRQAAERSREAALIRLRELYGEIQLRKNSYNMNEVNEEGEIIIENEEDECRPTLVQYRHASTSEIDKFKRHKSRPQHISSKNSFRNEAIVRKKKPSILHQLRSFLRRHFRIFFG